MLESATFAFITEVKYTFVSTDLQIKTNNIINLLSQTNKYLIIKSITYSTINK